MTRRTASEIDADIAALQAERDAQAAQEAVQTAKRRTDHYCPEAAEDEGFQQWRARRDLRRMLEEDYE